MEETKALIPLATAHVTQTKTDKAGKSTWSVEANESNEVLAKLDANYTEKQVFEILDFARKYELLAMNIGVQFQKDMSDTYWKNVEAKLKKVIKELTVANDRLAEKLETLIGEEV